MTESATSLNPIQSLSVYPSAGFKVTIGANEGDALSFAEDLVLDDLYELNPHAETVRLCLQRVSRKRLVIAATSEIGIPGSEVHLDCVLTFMASGATVTEVLVLVEVNAKGNASEVYMLPLGKITPQTDYRLVGIDSRTAAMTFAQVACVSFTRGTHITMGDGRQRRIEELQPGDKVLTRDDGVQKIRWIGQSTQRAEGDFAPIRIAAGTLNNDHDLVVSPDHRLFIYQRSDQLGTGRPELLVRARHLVNGQTVTVQKGGFVDYFQILFDSHQIIYAEGIAAESMLIDDRTAAALPEGFLVTATRELANHRRTPLNIYDVQEGLLKRSDLADVLRRASMQ